MNEATTIRLNSAIHDQVLAFLTLEERGRTLDVGAGDGALAKRLRDAGFEVRVVDRILDDFRIEDVPADEADLNERLPYGEQKFDVVVCTEVIEHIENPWQFIREFHRILRPGGILIVSTPNLDNVFVRLYFLLTGKLFNFLDSSYRDIGHITPTFLWSLRRLVETRFHVEDVSYNANWIPKTTYCLPGRSRLLGQCVVVKLRRLDTPTSDKGRRWNKAHVVREEAASSSQHL